MTTRRPFRTLFLPLFALAAAPLAAATYVMPSDATLADQAAVIAAVRVTDSGPAPPRAGIATDYVVEVDEVVKGDLPGSAVVVRVPGGEMEGNFELRVSGAPRFVAGERALLFLVPNRDGSYGVLHLFLGAFHAVREGGRTLARRDLAEGRPLAPAADPARDLARFSRWLADRAAGIEAEGDYLVAGGGPQSAVEAFSALPTPDRVPMRWFRFDGGGSVSWRLNTSLPAGVGAEATAAALRAALAAWSDDATSRIGYAYGGTTSASGGFLKSDGTNGVLFEDPGNAHVPGSYNCAKGGVVALGVAFMDSRTRSVGGKAYHEIVEGDVVTNDGSACYFRDNPSGAAEVFAHELGHTLGFGHSTVREALMFGVAHKDGRGARLEHDDRLAANSVYGAGSPPPAPPAPAARPAAPAGLAGKAVAPTAIELTWRDVCANELDFRLELKVGKKWREVLVVPAGATAARLTGLRPDTASTYRLRARNAAGFSPYSNAVTVRTPR
ncbi:MAG TPA: matrixin family metalloprotease [Thermoanaerobaculia bacterium]|nr:matrixin family metalloprotease [Thermoanaerobaculia bacterium]